mgnify:CR=1 FL=1
MARLIPRMLIMAALGLAGCSDEHNQQHLYTDDDGGGAKPYVEVTGTGEQELVPDRFRVRARARRKGDAIPELTDAVNQEVDTILSLASELNIADQAITASSLRVHPLRDHQREGGITGYRVERPVEIETQSMETQARLLTALARAGVRAIQPLEARSSGYAQAERNALAAAVADARSRAHALLADTDTRAGAILRVTERGGSGPRPLTSSSARAQADGANWHPGTQQLRRQVRVRFRLR